MRITPGLPEDVEHFLDCYIRSVEQLDVLLLLADEPGRIWTAEQIGRHLRSQPNSVRQRLLTLETHRLVRSDRHSDTFRFDESDRHVATAVRDVAKVYKERRVSVISFIFSRPSE